MIDKNKLNKLDQEIDELENSFSKYENNLKRTKYLSYFVEKILIPESMKLEKVKDSKFGKPPHCLILPGEKSHKEEEFVEGYE